MKIISFLKAREKIIFIIIFALEVDFIFGFPLIYFDNNKSFTLIEEIACSIFSMVMILVFLYILFSGIYIDKKHKKINIINIDFFKTISIDNLEEIKTEDYDERSFFIIFKYLNNKEERLLFNKYDLSKKNNETFKNILDDRKTIISLNNFIKEEKESLLRKNGGNNL